MSRRTRKTSVSTQGALAGFVVVSLLLTTSCTPSKKWTEVQSFSTKDKTVYAGQRFRLEPIDDGKSLIKDNGFLFEVTFSCSRLQGQEEVTYLTACHFFQSRASSKGGLAFHQTYSDITKKKWPSGLGTQKVKIILPFLVMEVGSGKRGILYFYIYDANDGTTLSNIVRIACSITASAK